MRVPLPIPIVLLLSAAGAFLPAAVFAQAYKLADTGYIATYENDIVGRIYFSQKYTTINLVGEENERLRYRPNTTFNMGIGVTHRGVSLNLALKGPFGNNDDEKGKTKYLDLQCHLYPRRWTFDFYGQNYKGYYLFPKGDGIHDGNSYYVRPDLKLNLYGLAVYRLSNGSKFSFRAPFLQSEWQHHSAGTWLLGAEVHGGILKGDSALVPADKSGWFPQAGVDKMKFMQIGPGGGYAYTLVIKKHFFITAAATINFNLGVAKEYAPSGEHTHFSFSPVAITRAAIGYNSRKWIITLTNVPNYLPVRNRGWNDPYLFSTGNFRLNFAHRFVPGPKLAKKLSFLDFN
ncbi:DUF4421 domain-containing protein [Flavihumibacter petaseus]|uniref:DUF4421 domain-containing protein n=1 Tax=Flavihumibacter petaseus NBRC 106054 TaxID=1220578 RepID=A0A0E9N1W8_9BACT|nr:DUF4421 domain-containing protein [Flavihumibacter petaseus]GAO43626.1 hypothetical protein FPE01S_02_07320 [Flavihumibacter petaseus NBRC 106054]